MSPSFGNCIKRIMQKNRYKETFFEGQYNTHCPLLIYSFINILIQYKPPRAQLNMSNKSNWEDSHTPKTTKQPEYEWQNAYKKLQKKVKELIQKGSHETVLLANNFVDAMAYAQNKLQSELGYDTETKECSKKLQKVRRKTNKMIQGIPQGSTIGFGVTTLQGRYSQFRLDVDQQGPHLNIEISGQTYAIYYLGSNVDPYQLIQNVSNRFEASLQQSGVSQEFMQGENTLMAGIAIAVAIAALFTVITVFAGPGKAKAVVQCAL